MKRLLSLLQTKAAFQSFASLGPCSFREQQGWFYRELLPRVLSWGCLHTTALCSRFGPRATFIPLLGLTEKNGFLGVTFPPAVIPVDRAGGGGPAVEPRPRCPTPARPQARLARQAALLRLAEICP